MAQTTTVPPGNKFSRFGRLGGSGFGGLCPPPPFKILELSNAEDEKLEGGVGLGSERPTIYLIL